MNLFISFPNIYYFNSNVRSRINLNTYICITQQTINTELISHGFREQESEETFTTLTWKHMHYCTMC